MAASQDLYENISSEEVERLLLQSCHDGQKDVVDLLLSKGTGLDVKDEDGRTPLVLASMSGHEDIVTLILDHGVDVRDKDRKMALMEACENGHGNVVKTLVERGVDPNRKDEYGTTALMRACENGHDKVAELLIDEYKCNLNERDSSGKTAFIFACMSGHDGVVEILMKHVSNVNERDDNGRSAFMWACQNGHDKVLRLLIKDVSDMNEKDGSGDTASLSACMYGHANVLKVLIEHGANIKGGTNLIWACRFRHLAVVELLVGQSVDVNAEDENGVTPLMSACGSRSKEEESESSEDDCAMIVRLLLEHGADVDAKDKWNGESAVTAAVRTGNAKCLRELLSAGPDLDLVDNYGKSAFVYAIGRNSTECLQTLIEDGKLLRDGRINPVHKDPNVLLFNADSIFKIAEYEELLWEWCPTSYFTHVTLAALKSGASPGKIKYDSDTYLSPLIISLLENESEFAETLLEHLFYYPEDYRVLCEDKNIRERITNKDILDKITLQPLSLQSWCYLTVSKAISTSSFPVKRCERVDVLPISDKCKKILNFK